VRKLIVIVVTLALFLALFLLPAGGMGSFMGPWFWFMVLSVIVLLWSLLAAPDVRPSEPPPGPRMIAPEEQPAVVREVMDVDLAEEERGIKLFRGRLRESADAAFQRLRSALGSDTVPLVRPDDRCGAAIVLMSRPVEGATLEHRVRPWLHWTLFGLTFLTTTWAGAVHQGIDVWLEPARIVAGLPYSIALLAILGVHELGHYWTARRHQMNVTPPFFVPIPFALGTFGAFIQMRSPAENRRTLFDVAVAGPLAGLVVAIPALMIGLRSSEVLAPSSVAGALSSGALPSSSILFTWLAHLSLGNALGSGDVIRLSPLAFAGWLGLFITGLNLLPVGQLDGGHIARAMFGSRAGAIIGGIAMWSLVLLGLFVWPGLLTWALVVFFIAGRGTPPLNDITRITPGRMWLGCFAFVILFLIMVPAKLVELVASHCPYI
jgi:membrane-associated protease RseP (regulator of RpoE activity)